MWVSTDEAKSETVHSTHCSRKAIFKSKLIFMDKFGSYTHFTQHFSFPVNHGFFIPTEMFRIWIPMITVRGKEDGVFILHFFKRRFAGMKVRENPM